MDNNQRASGENMTGDQRKMDAELKEKWVEALRSGEFKQGKHFFRDHDDRHCCLGVLCVVREIQPMALGGFDNNWKGVDDVLENETQHTLWKMNDGGVPFPEIADYIEKNL